MRALPKLPAWTAAALVALAGCLLTGEGLRFLEGVRQREAAARQDQRIEAARSALETALHRDEDLLFAGRAFLNGSTDVSAQDWRGFVASLDLPARHPGLKSMAFLVPVPRGGAETYLAARRRAGQALELHDRFTPWPGDPAPGPPDPDLIVIQYLEPAATNLGGLGLDAGANPVQRQAAEEARDTGRPVLTGRLTFGDLSQRDPAMGYFLPVYRGGVDPGTSEVRRQRLVGWISLGLWARPLFQGVFQAAGCAGQDAIEAVDAGPAGASRGLGAVLYGEGGPLGATWRAV
ncbi:MAG TPA: CHASE domain-containing protein, partial [Holophagaceae bacterium]|nr:CHASE domain-containing protein [Holophagaceae bacterium]